MTLTSNLKINFHINYVFFFLEQIRPTFEVYNER